MTVDVRYDAPPTLSSLLDSNAFVRVVMGPIGSGKSSGCVVEILRRASEQAPGPDGVRRTRFAVVRNTYRELQDTTRKTFEQWVPAALGKWNEQDFAFAMKFRDVECEVLFRALDRPQDVKKLLSLELTGAYVNELRELPKAILDGLQGRVGRYPSRAQGGPTWWGVWADTNPWHTGHWASKLFRSAPEGHALFRQPGGRSPEAENVENLVPGYYRTLCHGKDSDWIRVYVDGEEASSDIGSIWGNQLDALQKRGGICEFEVPRTGLFTIWDLGISDPTSIWVLNVKPDGAELVDHYRNTGVPLSHYFDWVDSRGYTFIKHWIPHDGASRTLTTGLSVFDMCVEHWGAGMVELVPHMGLPDGIQAFRWLLEQPGTRIHEKNCADGLESLREYRYEWDEEGRCFSKKPLHNWASHDADGARYAAVIVKHLQAMTKPKRKAKPADFTPKPYTMNDALKEHRRNQNRSNWDGI